MMSLNLTHSPTPDQSRFLPAQSTTPRSRFAVKLAAAAEGIESSIPDSNSNPKPVNQTLKLATAFKLWYFHNVIFNIYNKKSLNVFPYPWFLATFQLFTGCIWMLASWSINRRLPKISKEFLLALLGPTLFHTVTQISACVSYSNVAVSFTYVIKSVEPVFFVTFSSFLGEIFPLIQNI
ncbi:unnamed protein product [Linum trigynum]|uniref:Sugar phosphate transporter domain-containing protein n=1 Tax=Linum trigynum TaxID=586398 RepID=A0AAV2FAM1_9ROSI